MLGSGDTKPLFIKGFSDVNGVRKYRNNQRRQKDTWRKRAISNTKRNF